MLASQEPTAARRKKGEYTNLHGEAERAGKWKGSTTKETQEDKETRRSVLRGKRGRKGSTNRVSAHAKKNQLLEQNACNKGNSKIDKWSEGVREPGPTLF